ncbi:MAG: glycosyltransferase family 2 protein [Planctomycetota bacterium]
MRALVVIPVYNEEKTIASILARTRPYAPEILIVDDGSTDDTWEALTRLPNVAILRHRVNLGYGQSLIDAFQFAVEERYDCVVTLDADAQHEPEYIPAFLAELAACDVASGTRYPEGFDRVRDVPADRLAINRRITDLINERTRYRLTDSFCGFKAYRADALARLTLREPGYGMCLEFWIKAAAVGLAVKEVPVRRIYLDPNRTFGARLDDPSNRLRYYLQTIERAAADVAARRSCPLRVCGTSCSRS